MTKFKSGDNVKTIRKFIVYENHHGDVLEYNESTKLYKVKFTNGLTTNFFEKDLLFIDEIEAKTVIKIKEQIRKRYDDEALKYDLTMFFKKIVSLKEDDAFLYYIRKISDIKGFAEEIEKKYQSEYDSLDQVSKKMLENLDFVSVLVGEFEGALYSLESLIDDVDEDSIYVKLKNNYVLE